MYSVVPEHEISAINDARMAQKTNDEVRELVEELHRKRTAA